MALKPGMADIRPQPKPRPKRTMFSWRLARWVGGSLAVLIVLGLLTPWPALILQAPLAVNEAPRASDVIIVLGGGIRPGGDPVPQQVKDRLARGARLYHENLAPVVIVTGGLSTGTGRTEADVMQPQLEQLGVPTEKIIQEGEARDTYENAKFSKALMAYHGWETALVVTSAYHTGRSCDVFRRLEMQVRCIAAPLDDHGSVYERLANLRSVVREYGATLYYFMRGRI